MSIQACVWFEEKQRSGLLTLGDPSSVWMSDVNSMICISIEQEENYGFPLYMEPISACRKSQKDNISIYEESPDWIYIKPIGSYPYLPQHSPP